jgi:hypothetical protein
VLAESRLLEVARLVGQHQRPEERVDLQALRIPLVAVAVQRLSQMEQPELRLAAPRTQAEMLEQAVCLPAREGMQHRGR